MTIGRKDYREHPDSVVISSDDPAALEKLAAKLRMLEAESPPNRGRIYGTKKRIARLERIDRMEHTEQSFPGGRFLTDEDLNRIRFLFDLPPDAETERELKRLDFHRKSPSEWQGPRTPKYLRRAFRLLDRVFPSDPFPASMPCVRRTKCLFYLQALLEALELPPDASASPPAPGRPGSAPTIPALLARFSGLPGLTVTVKGAQTSSPRVWLSGDTEPYKKDIQAMGGRYAGRKQAYYFKPAPEKQKD